MTTSDLSRRSFLQASAVTGAGVVLAGSIDAVVGTSANAAVRSTSGYGPLVADPAGILSLPEGFSYAVIGDPARTVLDSGEPTPTDFDGIGTFTTGKHETTLVVNHEISGSERGPEVPVKAGLTYDAALFGGTTNVVVDQRGRRVREYVSLAGTDNNCAGGVTPWGTWLTCEETENRKGSRVNGPDGPRSYPDGTPVVRLQDHGYVFEVDPVSPLANQGKSAVPLRFLGRFAHEAVAVDPVTSVIYETEDASNPHGLFLRWTPPAGFVTGKDALRTLQQTSGDDAGTLDALACYDGARFVPDLAEAAVPGTTFAARWVPVPDRQGAGVPVRRQFNSYAGSFRRSDAADVTRARKLEGQWWGDGGTYFVSSYARTSDGSVRQHDGQVWFYDPAAATVELKTVFAYTPTDQDGDPDGPDNITVSPYGGVILAEDGEGRQSLLGVTDGGETYLLARNEASGTEFCGPVFSADGRILFVAIQDAYLFAITGPWKTQRG